MADVSMPRLSDSMEEGTILKWLKSDGDEVKRGDELVEIETDKANMTYEADQDGVLSISASEGDTLAVGEKIASIGEAAAAEEPQAEDQEQPEPQRPSSRTSSPRPSRRRRNGALRRSPRRSRSPRSREPEPEPEQPAAEDGGTKTTPARRTGAYGPARSRGGWPARWVSSSRRWRAPAPAAGSSRPTSRPPPAATQEEPATATAEAPPQEAAPAAEEPRPQQPARPAPAPAGDGQTGRGASETQELTRLQQTVARRMAESKATAPDFVLNVEVDMEEAVELRKQLKAAAGDRTAPSFNDLVVKAAALALTEFPRANGAYRDGAFELYSRVNVGVAVAGQDALVVPTIFDADRKSLGEIARETRALAGKVRDGKITPPELSAGTFTVSNLGMYGIDRIVPGDQPAAGRDPRRRRDEPEARRPRRRGDRPHAHGAHARLRPPDPLRRRRRGVPLADPRAARAPAQPRASR